MTVGEKIHYLRIKHNMTMDDLARELGVQRSAICYTSEPADHDLPDRHLIGREKAAGRRLFFASKNRPEGRKAFAFLSHAVHQALAVYPGLLVRRLVHQLP